MRTIISILGTVLVILGIIGFYYKYVIYHTNENIAQIGEVNVTAQKEKVVVISPLISAITLGSGIVLLIISLNRK